MREFDERIGMFCNELGINYSRYSDDMTFSGDFDTSIVISKVKEELKIKGLYLNLEKTRILNDGTRKEVTNITVNEKLNVSKTYLKEIRKVAYYIEKYGVINHLNRIKDDSEPLKYLFSIRGKILYSIYISGKTKPLLHYLRVINNEIMDIQTGWTRF